jgi:serine/threonine protein kinase
MISTNHLPLASHEHSSIQNSDVHDRMILHRDLNTANVRSMHSNTVKLCEFGIAKVLHSTSQLTSTMIGYGCH